MPDESTTVAGNTAVNHHHEIGESSVEHERAAARQRNRPLESHGTSVLVAEMSMAPRLALRLKGLPQALSTSDNDRKTD